MESNLIEWLHDEAPKRKIYERSPLALALCQVRFAQKYRLSTNSAVAPFQEAIESIYPSPQEGFSQSAEFKIGGPSGAVGVQSSETRPLWQFSDAEETWTVTLAPDFVSLETRAYEHFEDFLDRLNFVLNALTETIKPTLCRRIGLRYIDEMRKKDRDWPYFIRPELLGVLQLPPFAAACVQATQVMALRTGDLNINFQHGVFPQGTTVVPKQGEAVEASPFYLLDIDMYQEFNAQNVLAVDAAQICHHVEKYHSTVSDIFRWATTDDYRDSLGERNDAGESAD